MCRENLVESLKVGAGEPLEILEMLSLLTKSGGGRDS